jgi:hypothetical protein
MKLLLLGLSLILGGISFGKSFTKQADGKIVEYTSIAGKATFKQSGDMAAGSLYWGLHDVVCGTTNSMEKHRTFSGRVADYNIGTPLKEIPIFMATDDKPPVMMALSDNDGKFSFRIDRASDDSFEKQGYPLPKDFTNAFLYVGCFPSFRTPGMPRPEVPKVGSPLPEGSQTSQYPITDILEAAALRAGDTEILAKEISGNRQLRLTGAQISVSRAQFLTATFVEVGTTNTAGAAFLTQGTPHEVTLETIVRSCVDWSTPTDRHRWHKAKHEAVFSAPTNAPGGRTDFSKWFLISLNLTNEVTK